MVDNTLDAQTEAELALAQAHVDNIIRKVTEQIDTLTFDPNDGELLTELVEGFADKRGMVRLRIAETLGQIGEPATPFLTKALSSHENPVVRRACAKSLTLIGDPTAIPILINAILHDEDTVVKGSSVGALARTGEAAAPELIKILESSDTTESMKGHAAWALAFIGAEAKDLLYQALETDNVEVRAAVVAAIAKVTQEDPNANNFAILINALNDEAETVRSEAAAVLGNLAHKPAIPTLLQLLEHPVWGTRKSAILSLMKIGDASVLETLKASKEKDSEASSGAIYTLAIGQLEKQQQGANDWD
ncbi:HEAT repeat domain-containing protein [Leptolyngbyaceae cyanobacterium CCMR0082]|uniref:HEAT repeat domain-containing protein n=2 Tax=Adonisia turfae TaxID=2950184 RepID=A0A6M0SCW3_9CYAN|nr:HEAT repeat domain-containing protein [Adonisia turfae]MDV3352646.1 HEAT repeat domain-containing protein [Leptothoe sp. LEGE 181152]NEZ59201.1 HEAT repeat domain-containing protein [Adonisia turfae CCMR0081]NEZ65811.1 HEAT repeat domain-containing protein [Adonisia turfae CCMR0082]